MVRKFSVVMILLSAVLVASAVRSSPPFIVVTEAADRSTSVGVIVLQALPVDVSAAVRDAGLAQDAAPDAAPAEPPYLACRGLTLTSISSVWNLQFAEGCTHLQGDLIVREFVTQASEQQGLEQALRHVSKIDGNVIFADNEALTSLDALRSLQSVGGDMIVFNNPKLETVRGLSELTSVGGEFALNQLPALTTLEGLAGLKQTGFFAIAALPKLRVLTPLSLTRARGVIIRDCSELETLHGLNNLQDLVARLEIAHNARLTSLSGLDGLKAVEELRIRENKLLASLSGLEQLARVEGAFSLQDLPALVSAADLRSLNSVGGAITISDNPSLRSLSGFEQLAILSRDLSVSRNRNLTALRGLSALRNVEGSLTISGNPALGNLAGLDVLVRVGGWLSIEDNDALSSLEGAPSLTSVGRLQVSRNDALIRVSTLSGLRHADSVSVAYNPALSRCDVERLVSALDTDKRWISVEGNRDDDCP